MSLKSMLEDNGYIYLSKEYKEVEKDFRKIGDLLNYINKGIRPASETNILRIINVLEKYKNIKGDFGNADIHDIRIFLEQACFVLNKSFIKHKLSNSTYRGGFNPKKYGNDKEELKQYAELIEKLKQ